MDRQMQGDISSTESFPGIHPDHSKVEQYIAHNHLFCSLARCCQCNVSTRGWKGRVVGLFCQSSITRIQGVLPNDWKDSLDISNNNTKNAHVFSKSSHNSQDYYSIMNVLAKSELVSSWLDGPYSYPNFRFSISQGQ